MIDSCTDDYRKVSSEKNKKIEAMLEYGLLFALPKIKGAVSQGKLKCRGIKLKVQRQNDGAYIYSFEQREKLLAPVLIIKHVGLVGSKYVINFNYDPQALLSDIKNILNR